MKLTDRMIAGLPVPEKGNQRYPDSEVRGLNVVVTATGLRSLALRYRIGGKERLYTIGEHPTWLIAAARAETRRLRRLIDQGIDPAAERQEQRQAPTVADLAERYEAEHLPTKRPRSAVEDRALFRTYILPVLGRIRVADVTTADVRRLHREITYAGKPVRANRMLALARTLFGCAVGWGMRADNPARGGRGGIAINPEDGRERFVSPADLARLAEVLDRHPERTTAALIRFLVLTGARFGEVVRMTWGQIDLDRGLWIKPSGHTKQKREHRVPLSAPALALLSSLPRGEGNALVFPSPRTGRPLVTVKTAWRAIRRDAALEDVRLHDLRHSFASILASSGASLQLIGSLLGHTQVATTRRYAHLADDARREAVERVGAILTVGPPAEVVSLTRKRVGQ
jgi:integrase